MEGSILTVGDEQIDLSERGTVQIARLSKATFFINRYGRSAVKEMDFSGMDEKGQTTIIPLIIEFVSSLDENAFILAGEIVSGRDAEFVEEHFDVDWVMDGLEWLLAQGPFRKLLARFFGNAA